MHQELEAAVELQSRDGAAEVAVVARVVQPLGSHLGAAGRAGQSGQLGAPLLLLIATGEIFDKL